MSRVRFIGASTLALVFFAGSALADEKEACIAASEGADRLDDARKLMEMRDRLVFCARDACPTLVRQECVRRLEELDKRIPTIVVRAVDAHGADIVDARVVVDDKVVAEQIDGQPIKLDPGVHMVAIRPAVGVMKTQRVVAAEGDHLRPVTIAFGATDPAASPSSAPADAAPAMTPGHPVQRWIGVGMIIGGVAGIAIGVGFTVSSLGLRDKFNAEGSDINTCDVNNDPTHPLARSSFSGGGKCHSVDSNGNTFAQSANSQLVLAMVVGITGVVLTAIGTVLLATSFPHAITKAKLVPTFAPGYGGLALTGAF